MGTRKTLYETVKINEHDIPINPDEFIVLINKNIDSIVEANGINRKDIRIEIDRDYGYYDSIDVFIGLSYRRLETDKEMLARVTKEKEIEKSEYERFLKLKKKFE
jgi:hypothetical protein